MVLLVAGMVELPGGLAEGTVALLKEGMVELPEKLGRGSVVLVGIIVKLSDGL